jgi:hypothetical protein
MNRSAPRFLLSYAHYSDTTRTSLAHGGQTALNFVICFERADNVLIQLDLNRRVANTETLV